MIVDAAIIAFTGYWARRGLRTGLVAWAVNALGFVVAVAVAVFGYRALARPLVGAGWSESLASLTAAILLFTGVSVGTWLAGRALTRILRLTKWGLLDRVGGAAAAGLWALAITTTLLLAVTVVPVPAGVERAVSSSLLGESIVERMPGVLERFARTDYRRFLATFLPQGRGEILLAATEDFRDEEQAARVLFDLLNEERAALELPLLQWDEALATAARSHAEDMYTRGYFAHRTPEGVELRDRLRLADVEFRTAAENLALAPTPSRAHNQLMASSRHRANILAERFARVGIAVLYGRQGYVAVQEFAG